HDEPQRSSTCPPGWAAAAQCCGLHEDDKRCGWVWGFRRALAAHPSAHRRSMLKWLPLRPPSDPDRTPPGHGPRSRPNGALRRPRLDGRRDPFAHCEQSSTLENICTAQILAEDMTTEFQTHGYPSFAVS